MPITEVRHIIPDQPRYHRQQLNGDGINMAYLLANAPIVEDSVSVIYNTNALDEADYTVDYENGLIIFDSLPADDDSISVDYKYTLLSDAMLQTYLTITGDDRLAAAMALDAIAVDQALLLKVISLFDLRTDGAAMARVLLQRAKDLRESFKNGGDAPAFDIAEMNVNKFARREIYRNAVLRNR